MRIAYQYKLRPSASQKELLDRWLEMLRCQYNWLLAERFDWYEQNRSPVNACPLVCHLPELKEQPNYYNQKRSLVALKQNRPWYKDIHSQVLQDMVKRVHLTFERFLKGDSSGKRSGRPRFKGKGRYRSLTFPQASLTWIEGKYINLPKIGPVKVIWHRPIPDGFTVKTATVSQKADGWYLTLSLEDTSVPIASPDTPTVETTIGIDMGLSSFLVTDSGKDVPIPQHYRKAEKKLKRLQRSLSRKKKGSNRRKKAVKRVAKTHLKVFRQRKDFHYKTAHKLLSQRKHIAHENLNIKGIAKSSFAKSTLDAGWGTFLQILSVKAANAGLTTIAVNPSGTTQNCSGCGTKVPKTIQDRWHSCHVCGLELSRDHNAAINIKHSAVGHPVEYKKAQDTPDGIPGVTEKPALYASA